MYHAGLNFIMLTPGNVHDTQAMDSLPVEAGAYYLMDKGYVDFTLEAITIAENIFFVSDI